MFNRAGKTDEQNQSPLGGPEHEERITSKSQETKDITFPPTAGSDDPGAASAKRSPPSAGKNVAFIDKPKRKRRSPKVPWKKPPGMPKRPLSAYNFYFAHERERLVKRSMAMEEATQDGSAAAAASILDVDDKKLPSYDVSKFEMNEQERKSKSRRHMKTSGIGFANLAKIIGPKWKNLDPEARATFEKQAAIDKERYDNEMVVWRSKQRSESTSPDAESPLKRRSSEPLLSEGRAEQKSSKLRRLSAPALPGDDFDIPTAALHPGGSVSPLMEAIGGDSSDFDSDDAAQMPPSPPLIVAQMEHRLLSPLRRQPSNPGMMRLSPSQPGHDPILDLDPNLGQGGQRSLGEAAERREETKDEPSASVVQESLQLLQSSLDEEQTKFLTNLPFEE